MLQGQDRRRRDRDRGSDERGGGPPLPGRQEAHLILTEYENPRHNRTLAVFRSLDLKGGEPNS